VCHLEPARPCASTGNRSACSFSVIIILTDACSACHLEPCLNRRKTDNACHLEPSRAIRLHRQTHRGSESNQELVARRAYVRRRTVRGCAASKGAGLLTIARDEGGGGGHTSLGVWRPPTSWIVHVAAAEAAEAGTAPCAVCAPEGTMARVAAAGLGGFLLPPGGSGKDVPDGVAAAERRRTKVSRTRALTVRRGHGTVIATSAAHCLWRGQAPRVSASGAGDLRASRPQRAERGVVSL
jgi:hypothetical protein